MLSKVPWNKDKGAINPISDTREWRGFQERVGKDNYFLVETSSKLAPERLGVCQENSRKSGKAEQKYIS